MAKRTRSTGMPPAAAKPRSTPRPAWSRRSLLAAAACSRIPPAPPPPGTRSRSRTEAILSSVMSYYIG